MNLRRLKYFVKIVDIGSLTQAADVLHIAQPALSQQLVTLEAELQQQLLIRTKRGVTPTEAGKVLYGHAQVILRQCEQAQSDVNASGLALSGPVSVGLAPGTAASTLSLPLLKRVRERHPGILLYLNENFGTTLSELIMNGRMDMAVLYGGREVHGLSFVPLIREQLYGECRRGAPGPRGNSAQRAGRYRPAVAPHLQHCPSSGGRGICAYRTQCPGGRRSRIFDDAGRCSGRSIRLDHSSRVCCTGAGRHACGQPEPHCRTEIEAPLALCLSGHLPLSVPAQAVKAILLELVAEMRGNRRTQ